MSKNQTQKAKELLPELMKLHDDGMYYQDIADKYDLSIYTVQRALNGYKRNKWNQKMEEMVELYRKGRTIAQLAEQYEISEESVKKRVKDFIPKTEYPVNEWINLYNTGYSITDICEMYYVARSTVSKHLRGKVLIRPGRKVGGLTMSLDDLVKKWVELYNSGWSWHKIAQEYNSHEKTIKKYLENKVVFREEVNV